MRMLLKAHPDNLKTNPKFKDGSLGEDLNAILSDLKPESVYFYFENGRRTAQMIFNIQDQSELPDCRTLAPRLRGRCYGHSGVGHGRFWESSPCSR